MNLGGGGGTGGSAFTHFGGGGFSHAGSGFTFEHANNIFKDFFGGKDPFAMFEDEEDDFFGGMGMGMGFGRGFEPFGGSLFSRMRTDPREEEKQVRGGGGGGKKKRGDPFAGMFEDDFFGGMGGFGDFGGGGFSEMRSSTFGIGGGGGATSVKTSTVF